MKSKFITTAVAFFFFLSGQPCLAVAQDAPQNYQSGKTLKDLYDQALKNSETIAISEQAVRQAEALYKETLGGSLPEFSYRHQTSLEDNEDSTNTSAFRAVKTDLTGYRELAAIRSGKSTVGQRKYEMQRVQQLLLQDIAVAFYGILLAEENVTTTNKLIELGKERLAELHDRVRVGRSREVDAIAQEVLISSLESQLEESVRQVNASRDLLAFLIGVSQLEDQMIDVPLGTGPRSLDVHLAQVHQRPDVEALVQNVKAAKGLLQVARSEFFPSLNVTANSYTDRPSSSEDNEWDVLLSVELPLWTWGARGGTVGAARAVLNQSELTLASNVRQAELDVRNAYRDYISTKKQLELRGKSVNLARRDYEMQVKDDKQGLVTNLEVFESLDRLNNAELNFNNARLEEKLAAINLEISSGANPNEILK